MSLLASKRQSVVDKTEEVMAKQSTSRKSLSTKRVISPLAETAETPSANNESLDTNKTVSPKKNQRGSRQKSLVTNKDVILEDMNLVETTSSTDLSQADIKLGTARGQRSKLSNSTARKSTIDSAVTDSSCDESNSKRRRQTNCFDEKVSKSGGLSMLSSDDNDEVSSVPTNSSNIEKPASGSRQRGKAAGKSAAVSIEPLYVCVYYSLGSRWLYTPSSVFSRPSELVSSSVCLASSVG